MIKLRVKPKRWGDELWMEAAELFATQSSCKKAQVGCLIVNNKRLIAMGVNGTIEGDSNDCEDSDGNTEHWRVHHAEMNALRQVSVDNVTGATVYVTLAPCWECAKAIIAHKPAKLVYGKVKDEYEEVLEYLSQYMEVTLC
jgi:dCMP deaminase